MPSTYSPLLRLELMQTGEKSATWGDITNSNLGTLLEKSIAGVATIDINAGDVTLTALNGADDEARAQVIILSGSSGAARNVIAPGQSKTYTVINASNSTATFKASATTGLAIGAGERALVAWSGSDFVRVGAGTSSPSFTGTASFQNITASGSITGSLSGNASTATALQTARTINGVSFNGTANITVTAAAGTLSGATLAASVTASSLTSVGTLTALSVNAAVNATGGFVNTQAGFVTALAADATGSYLEAQGVNSLRLVTNGSERIRVDSAGLVGIGAAPSYRLDVASAAAPDSTPTARFGAQRSLFAQPAVGSTAIFGPVLGFGAYANGATGNYIQPSGIGMHGGALIAGVYGGGLQFYAYTAGAETGTTQTLASTLRMTLSASGDLGLGVSPAYDLHVSKSGQDIASTLQASAGFTARLLLAGNGTSPGTSSFDLQQDSVGAADIVNRNNTRMSLYTNATERLRLNADGSFYGTALHNNGGTGGASTQHIASGTYTPSTTIVSGASNATGNVCQWLRVGNVVSASGSVAIQGNSAAAVQIGLSLPVASSINSSSEVAGVAARGGSPNFEAIQIVGDTTNDRATIVYTNDTNTTFTSFFFTLTYVIN